MPNGYLLKKNDLLVAMTEQAPGLLRSSLLVPEDDVYLHNQRLGLVQIRDDQEHHSTFCFIFSTLPTFGSTFLMRLVEPRSDTHLLTRLPLYLLCFLQDHSRKGSRQSWTLGIAGFGS